MRALTFLAIFFVALNSWGLLLQTTGVGAMAGIHGVNQECPDNPTDAQIETIPDCSIEDSSGNNIEAGSSTGSTLFGMYNVVTQQVMGVLYVVLPGLNILARAGMPGYIIGFCTDIFGVLLTITGLSYLRGYDL